MERRRHLQKILANHLATLREQFNKIKVVDSQEFKDKFDEISKVKEAAQVMRSKAGGLLGDKSIGIPDDTLEGFLQQEKDLNKGAPLTDNQIKTAVNEHSKIEAAKNEFQKKYEDLQADYAKLLAEREVKKQASETKKNIKKTHEDFVKERNEIKASIKDKLKKAREQTSVTVVPYANELITIAPDVAKLVKSLIEEGVTKLDDIVKNIHGQLKEDIPDIKEGDVNDLVAGVYNEKKKTRNEVAEIAENLRIQAKLINKYEALLKGEEPKNEKAKIKRNQEIDGLRKKIKGLQKENAAAEKEANTFYGESDAAERRLQAKEDELERLKERRPKANTPKERREISDREKKLNQEIAEERKKIRAEEKEANTFYTEEVSAEFKKLQDIKKRNERELAKIQEQFEKGDFAKEEKKIPLTQMGELEKAFPNAYKDAVKSFYALAKAQEARRIRIAIQEFENMTPNQKASANIVRWVNVPRTAMTTLDLSAPGRQGLVASVAYPKIAKGAMATMFKHLKSQDAYDAFYHELREGGNWDLYKESKLGITDPHSLHTGEIEEAYLGGNPLEKIPIVGKYGIKASQRAYVSYLNKMRIDIFDMYAADLKAAGKTFANSTQEYKALASYVNTITGRGNVANFIEKYMPFLSSTLFAPRLIASRLNMLGITDIPNLVVQGGRYLVKGATLGKFDPKWNVNFGFYSKLPPKVRKTALIALSKTIGAGMALLYAADAAGFEVEYDPRSSDFGKIKVGNTRYDIWGGMQPYVRVFAQIFSGAAKSANTGKMYQLDGKKFGGKTEASVMGTFMRGKLNPIISTGWDIASRSTVIGEPVLRQFDIPFIRDANDAPEGSLTITDKLGNNIMPLLWQDALEAMKEHGGAGLAMSLPSIFGVGVNTYEPKPPKPLRTPPKPRKPPRPPQ
jgi:hypothetical protein